MGVREGGHRRGDQGGLVWYLLGRALAMEHGTHESHAEALVIAAFLCVVLSSCSLLTHQCDCRPLHP